MPFASTIIRDHEIMNIETNRSTFDVINVHEIALDIVNQLDENEIKTDNERHLIHILEAYRHMVIYGEDIHKYSPGSSRDISWKVGVKMFNNDTDRKKRKGLTNGIR